MKLFYLLLLLTLGLYAEKHSIDMQKISRYIDTKEPYGKSCEKYSFIPPIQRLKYIHHKDFLLGDLLSDTLTITPVEEAFIVKNYASACHDFNMDVSQYEYEEALEYLSDDIITIQVFQYQYGAGAAHGNDHTSHYIYDRDYGMALDWKSLFVKDSTFDHYIVNRVIKEIVEKEFIDYFKASDQIMNYTLPGYFSINREGLLIQYGKYEIASGAAGLPSIEVPKEVLKKYMKPGMYQKCFGNESNIIMSARNKH